MLLRSRGWRITTRVLLGMTAGLIIGAGVPTPKSSQNLSATRLEASPGTPSLQNIVAARHRIDAANAELTHALQEVDTKPMPTAPGAGEVRARDLREELFSVQKERIEREFSEQEVTEAARHHEALLRIAYDAQVATLAPTGQKRANLSLLRDEKTLAELSYQILIDKQQDTSAQATTAPDEQSSIAKHLPTSRRVVTAASGAFVGGILGLWFFVYRGRSLRTSLEEVREQSAENLSVKEAAKATATVDVAGEKAEYTFEAPLHGFIPKYVNEHPRLARQLKQAAEGELPPSRLVLFETRWRGRPGPLEEACRDAIYSVLLADWGKGIRSYAMVSAKDGDGKTTVLANMAMALGRSGLRIVVIDADLRRPNLHDIFFVENTFGLMNILRGEVDVDNVGIGELTSSTWLTNLAIVPGGVDSHELTDSTQAHYFAKLIERLTSAFDLVLIDTSSDPASSTAVAVAKACAATIVLHRTGTHQDAEFAIHESLSRDGVYVAGMVVNTIGDMQGSEICAMGRMVRRPFSPGRVKADERGL